MAETAVATNRDKATDILRNPTAQVTLDHVAVLQDLGDGQKVILAQIACLEGRIDLGALADALSGGRADTVEVRQGRLYALIVRNVYSKDSGHTL